jgi:uncharacterized protein (DUF1800 family)
VDGGYTQKDVQEVARCFTGWTIDRPNQGGGFVFRQWMHDRGSKAVLGVTIPGGGGITDGHRVIDLLSRHPSTARHVSKKLCQRFVSDSPPNRLVERVAQVFARTDGDIREVLRAIFASPEFNSAAEFRSKTKSPLELAASAIRALDGDTNGAPALHQWLRRMGGPLYQQQAPTGYGEDSSRWLNTGAVLARINFVIALANNQIQGTRYDLARAVELDSNSDRILHEASALLVHTQFSIESGEAIRRALSIVKPAAVQEQRARSGSASPGGPTSGLSTPASKTVSAPSAARIVEIVLGSSDFQRR